MLFRSLLYDSEKDLSAGAARYDEEHAEATGVFVEDGYLLMQKLLNK